MLWNAAQDYSSRKRMQRRNEQEEENEIGNCIEASLFAKLKYCLFIISWG
jgi:hypothetical protein